MTNSAQCDLCNEVLNPGWEHSCPTHYLCGHVIISHQDPCPTCFAATKLRLDLEHVHHPLHYGGESNPYEVIKVAEAWLTAEELVGALKFQIIKYTPRAGKKDNQLASQDIAKAAWYADYLAKFLKEIGK